MNLIFLLFITLAVPVSAQTGNISVFVSIPPQKQFVQKIGGNRVDVHVMLPPGESPETYSPSPKMLASLSAAKLYFQIGVPFEKNWINSIRSLNRNIQIITCCDQFFHADEYMPDADDSHHDLHIWGSPAYVKQLVKEIKETLSAVDPEHANQYAENYHIYIAELNALDREIQKSLVDRRLNHFIVSHAAWGYFAEQYGLEQVALEKNNRESGPKSLLNIIRLARVQGIHTLFVQQQYKTPAVNSLARELGADIVELDPLAEDYLGNMRVISARIAESLR
jgi:zinc transport system substrate-binding protein